MKKIVLLTGASKGIGLSFLKLLSRDPEVDEIWAISRTRSFSHPKIKWMLLDLTEKKSFQKILDDMSSENVKIKLLINNAGAGKVDEFKNTMLEDDEWVMNLNMLALIRLTKISLPFMEKKSKIIQVASTAGFIPLPLTALYAATKAFVLSFSEALSYELKKEQISITLVCPGPVDTSFFDYAIGSRPYRKSIFSNSPDLVAKKALQDTKNDKLYSFDRFFYGPLMFFLRILPKQFVLSTISYFKNRRMSS